MRRAIVLLALLAAGCGATPGAGHKAPGTPAASFRDHNGNIWVGTSMGLSMLEPAPDPAPTPDPVPAAPVGSCVRRAGLFPTRDGAACSTTLPGR